MIKIRKGTFESNSSSMHTLVRVGSKDKVDVLTDKYNHQLDFPHVSEHSRVYKYDEDSNYCFGPSVLTRPLDKATYLISLFANLSGAEEIDEIEHYEEILAEVQKSYPDFRGWRKNEVKDEDWWHHPFGSVDHQSRDILDDIEFEDVLKTINDPLCVYLIISDGYDLREDFDKYGILANGGEVVAPNWWG